MLIINNKRINLQIRIQMGFPAEFYLSKSDKIKQILKTEILWTFEHTTAKHGTKKQRKEIPGQFQLITIKFCRQNREIGI